ncbi:HD-GYP domain-containing protein [Idiomarina aminovorans]|uniref:HD-GYP domain-containing protein n=1 Tax=Idiomarina aminovorans TaxID=2914829 RepID=UPI002003E826|nr:HD domain-containing phosphohydrolase [Idiomarina sp. ATCH4]MCK7458016.1 HD domain-containing protein [Idiomarina sp. ATCH4]
MLNRLKQLWSQASANQTLQKASQTELLTSLAVMAWFVEAKDPYTGGHLWRVSQYAKLMAKHERFSAADTARIGLGGFLHDLGKVSIADHILGKPERLSEEEFDIMKTHPSNGARLLAAHPLSDLVIKAVELHHERPDGKGYPHGLTHAAIPVEAAIVGVADAFDAMTSTRPYSSPKSKTKALSILKENAGQQFNARWVNVMHALDEQQLLDEVLMHSDDGIPLHECPSCGPVVTQASDANINDLIACPLCNAEMKLLKEHSHWIAKPTGHYVSPSANQPKEDTAMIKRFIEQTVAPLNEATY